MITPQGPRGSGEGAEAAGRGAERRVPADTKKMPGAKNWCFTLNNYSPEDVDRLRSLRSVYGDVTYLIFGREVGESGTPHLQGYIQLSKRKPLLQVKVLLGGNPHLEISRGTVQEAAEYCKKDGDFEEFGEVFVPSPRRSDLEGFKDDVKAGILDMKELREKHSAVAAKYPRFCLEYVRDHKPRKEVQQHPLRGWQAECETLLDGEPDDRTVHFVVDVTGNCGKSWFAHWYCDKNPKCQVILPGKKADMAYSLEEDIRVLFVDAPRSKQGEYLQYDFLEEVKNGFVFSPKYESQVKKLQKLHVMVMMNEMPDMTKLSLDRYHIIQI